jgi:hypothetical protein
MSSSPLIPVETSGDDPASAGLAVMDSPHWHKESAAPQCANPTPNSFEIILLHRFDH